MIFEHISNTLLLPLKHLGLVTLVCIAAIACGHETANESQMGFEAMQSEVEPVALDALRHIDSNTLPWERMLENTSEPNPAEDASESTLCEVQCDDRTCGDNGCGGLCGVCADGETCSAAGVCEVPTPDCVPQCSRKACGDDGCGGVCGNCIDGTSCTDLRRPQVHYPTRLCVADTYAADSAPSCPPDESMMGNEIGDVVPEVALVSCSDFFPVNHRSMCGNTISVIYQINVDCAPCISYVNTVLGPLQEEFVTEDVEFYVAFRNAQECDTHRYFRNGAAEVNLTYLAIRHGYTHLFGSGGRASTLILSQGNVIEYYGKGEGTGPSGPSADMIRAYIESARAR